MHVRAKFYSKTLELLTSTGVTANNIQDPLSELLLTKNTDKKANYHRKIFSSDGEVVTRLEVSFYGSKLKKPCAYKELINKIFNPDRKDKCICSYNCFLLRDVKNIHLKILKGEQKYGRTIILKELNNGEIEMTFIRLINQIT